MGSSCSSQIFLNDLPADSGGSVAATLYGCNTEAAWQVVQEDLGGARTRHPFQESQGATRVSGGRLGEGGWGGSGAADGGRLASAWILEPSLQGQPDGVDNIQKRDICRPAGPETLSR